MLNAILVWLPVLLMCTTYIWIFIKVSPQISFLISISHPPIQLRVPKTDNTNAIQFRRLAHRRRVARMLSLILLSFIVCWIPFTVTISIRNSVIFLNLMNSVHL